MSSLTVFSNDTLVSQYELKPLITRIGRNRKNDIVIDNIGVSSNHAEIVKSGDKYTLYDLNSTNGVFVNGRKISEKELQPGDEIGIFKHRLRFAAVDTAAAEATEIDRSDRENIRQSPAATIEVDLSQLQGLLQASAKKIAYLDVVKGNMAGHSISLSRTRFSFGKSSENDFVLGGWFAPKSAARIVRQSDGYYLIPERRGKCRVNGQPVQNRCRIGDDSTIEIRGTTFRFSKHPD